MAMKFEIVILMIWTAFIGMGITGCAKSYSDYDCVWTSEDGCIQIDSDTGISIINITGVDQSRRIDALSDSGQLYLYFTYYSDISTEASSAIGTEKLDEASTSYNEDDSECYGSTIWEADSYIRNGKLYLTVVKDYISDWEGKTIVLEQKPRKE